MADNTGTEIDSDSRITELLFRNANSSFAIILINSGLVFLVLSDYVPNLKLSIWLITLVLITLARVVITGSYWRARNPYGKIKIYRNLHLLGIYLSAAIWGTLVYIPGEYMDTWIESFIAFVIAGMSAGTLISLSPLLSAAIPYLIFILMPLAVYFFRASDFPHLAMGLMVTLYLILLVRLVFRSNFMIVSAVTQNIENRSLFDFLEKAKIVTEDIQEKLENEITRLPRSFQEKAGYFSAIDLPVLVTDLNGKVRHVNEQGVIDLMRSEDDILDRQISEFTANAEASIVSNVIRRLKAGRQNTTCELNILRPDADPLPTDWKIMRHGNLLFWTGNKLD